MNDPAPRAVAPNRLPWILLGAIVLVIAAVMFIRSRQPAAPPIAAAPTDTAVAAPVDGNRRPPSAGLSGADAAALRESVRDRTRQLAQKKQAVQAQVDQTQAQFSSRFKSERTDTAWAGAKASTLEGLRLSDQMRQMEIDPKNMNVDCKSTMCRITADFPNTSAGDDWATLYMNNVAAEVPAASYKYIQNPDGTVTIDMYAIGRK